MTEEVRMPPRKPTSRSQKNVVEEPAQLPVVEDGESEEARVDFAEVVARVKSREEEPPPRRAARERQEREVQETAAALTVEAVVRGIGDLRLEVNGALDRVSTMLTEQAKRLVQIEEAIAVRLRRLAELYDIEVAADTLASLVARYEQSARDLEAQAVLQRQAFEAAEAARQAEAERQAAEQRAAREFEKHRFMQAFEEEKAVARKAWDREKEEYEYAWKLRRTRDDEEFKVKRQAQQVGLAEERARQEQQLAERGLLLDAREAETTELRARALAFPAQLASADEKARQEATAAAEERARTVAELRSKDADASDRLLKQRIQTLEATVKEQTGRIEELVREQREATDRVRDIALKAIEGASGASALARVSDIAMQQAKGRGEG
jgi:colicin import membrane protein